MKGLIMFLLLFCAFSDTYADTAWQLKTDKEGIKIYTASMPNTNMKAVKVTCVINGSLSALAAMLLDVKTHSKWSYGIKSAYTVKKLGPGHIIYYSVIKMPEPFKNRDIVADMQISQKLPDKTMYINVMSAKQYVAVKKGIVRVQVMNINWKVSPVGKGQISIEYTAEVDPGGDTPAWLVNLFSAKGPFQTFKKIKKIILSPAYSRAQYKFIQN